MYSCRIPNARLLYCVVVKSLVAFEGPATKGIDLSDVTCRQKNFTRQPADHRGRRARAVQRDVLRDGMLGEVSWRLKDCEDKDVRAVN